MKDFKKNFLPYIIFVLIVGSIIAIDQITKIFTIDKSFSLIGDFIWIQSTFNTGAAFSFGAGSSAAMWIFLVLSFIVIILVLYIIIAKKISDSYFFKISLAVLTGGIIGNLIDRLAFGYVRDFIYLKFMNFAIFNVADMALTISCILLAIWVIFLYHPNKNKKTKSEDSTNE